MKRFCLLLSLLFLLTGYVSSEKLRFGAVLNYYNEPALKPGVTVGFDTEYRFSKRWSVGLTAPEFTYFRFPLNYEAFYLYPELGIRFVGKKGFYWSLATGSGFSWSRKIVPVYNLAGHKIDAPFDQQLMVLIQMYFGYDLIKSRWERPVRLYGSIGWKGIYPNNLGFQNQPMFHFGINYGFRKKEKS